MRYISQNKRRLYPWVTDRLSISTRVKRRRTCFHITMPWSKSISLWLPNAPHRTTLSVCLNTFNPFSLFALYSKNLQATHTWKFLTLPKFFLRMPIRKKSKNVVLSPLRAFLGHPVQNDFYAFIKKIFL